MLLTPMDGARSHTMTFIIRLSGYEENFKTLYTSKKVYPPDHLVVSHFK